MHSTFNYSRKVPNIHGVPRGGYARVLSMERLYTSRGDLRTRKVSMEYRGEVVLESCLWRGYIPAEEIYALARCPVSMVYHREDVLEYYLCRGYIPAGGTYALGSLSNPRRCLAAAAERASIKQKKNYTLQH